MGYDFVELGEVTGQSPQFEEVETIDLAKRKPDHSSRTHPGLDRSPKENWVDKVGGLPSYIERIAKHIHSDSGLSISHAIAAAVNRVKVLAAKGNAQAIKALAEWNAKKARSKGKAKNLSTTGEVAEVIDLGLLRRSRTSVFSTKGGAPSSKSSGVRGSAFDEAKHQRTTGGKFGNKLNPSEILDAKRRIEGNITNLQVGQTYALPDKVGWVKRTPGGYFVQGSAGFTASVRTLSEAVQAAAMIVAGKARGSV
jgi:hypothetical protein